MKLQVSNIKKSYGAQDVLEKATLSIRDKEKIALVGKNGCGKTTLLKIICDKEQPDQGSRVVQNGVRIGYLAQITFSNTEHTVYQELSDAFARVKELETKLHEQASILETDASEKQMERYARLQSEFEALNGYQYEVELKNVFFHFGFEEDDLYKTLDEFSSGQRTRIALVKLLLSKPDVLLLDEPTNHLDIESIEWLENYVRHYPSAIVLVSHDRMFLDHVVDEIIEIEYGVTTRYVGNYSHYVKAKEEFIKKNHEAFLRQQAQIQRLEELIEKFRYKKNKAAFAQSKIKYLERMDRIQDRKADTSSMHATFQCARKGGKQVLEVENLKIGYDKPLSTVSFSLIKGQRMAVVGPNGIGKSTLIKTLMHKVPALSGQFHFGHQIDVGYFDQDSAHRKSNKTVIDTLWDVSPDLTQTQIRNTLASFLFTQEEVFKEINTLSGGEKVRLALAELMLMEDNLLLLDEPTNHLDIPTKEALEKALEKYDGTILFVSHDRMFLSKMANRVLEMGQDCKVYDCTYAEYIEKKEAGTLLEAQPQIEKSNVSVQSFKDRKALKNRVDRLEQLLEAAQEDLEALRELRYEPEYYQDYQKMEELDQQIDDKHNEIAHYTQEWEEKMELLESMS
ncbi:MAG: ABC-F type ribosomal protection protein [Faecalicoccus sp.]|uniref:ABC-F family ATP-binding cassette domain-containing protein n=1 Tax=unclassified Faecalicoccus TaxID=2643311 RepID=UPI0025F3D2F2|nr:ABC-F type ribosomal protection protein [Faecalicoccus sp.]MCI6379190.1 ABC-F type ribosomal protection protein [Erysipelotrichaceae bacterium]MDY4869677.1 ABC-F type ribosomal protection protein [Faecalicoccus sp.]